MMWLAFLFVSTLIVTLGFNSSWKSVIAGGFLLGFFWQQTALFAHDVCHNSVARNRYESYTATAVISCLVGIGGMWWKHTHNVHHVVTNDPECDPDIQHLPLFAISEFFLKGFYSKHHNRPFVFDKVAQFFVSYQHFLYYPIMALARVNLYAQTILFLAAGKGNVTKRGIELTCLLLFFAWNILVLSSLASYWHMIAYVFISHVISGLIHVQITISHFAMPVDIQPSTSYDFVKTQLDHTMDVSCQPWMDWFHGGLQFQTIHHLFPRLPRSKLRYVRDAYVKPYCEKHGLKYLSYDFLTCNWMVLNNFHKIALQAQENIIKQRVMS